ncbi:hypothetical protein GARC_4085 [Paraglaciecola arctica BSs20135]|uniref:Uncharacterized protein n=1 Tax=Paraglaciecola arctica BSs20135 TaxID=493475 RepID=K6YS79_9ALTE|nr:hypothetical protein GARC_4085 [Paraglaciecola arctica BSs20135]
MCIAKWVLCVEYIVQTTSKRQQAQQHRDERIKAAFDDRRI